MTTSTKSIEDIDGRCNCLAARQASRYLTAAYDRALSPVGLRATQFSILHKLASAGPLTIGELAKIIAMDRTTLSTNLKPLERDGLLEIRTGEDRRAREAHITNAGVKRYHQAFPMWTAVQDEFESSYGMRDAAALRKSLRSVLETGFAPWDE
ncbi:MULTISPECIES: MarR family winged helix-turn-helix transcriptional regulator [Paraburkholderia]|uniref:MarR family winged helix-turn-helix transcriptional regulator n=1 Tax=Paraburkholderia TaxID=1822464 RepID=UPI002AB770DA|nr:MULTISPECIES: MarR family winged helix-turn-helix transcriptional regulator [Paraburkholderia]